MRELSKGSGMSCDSHEEIRRRLRNAASCLSQLGVRCGMDKPHAKHVINALVLWIHDLMAGAEWTESRKRLFGQSLMDRLEAFVKYDGGEEFNGVAPAGDVLERGGVALGGPVPPHPGSKVGDGTNPRGRKSKGA